MRLMIFIAIGNEINDMGLHYIWRCWVEVLLHVSPEMPEGVVYILIANRLHAS